MKIYYKKLLLNEWNMCTKGLQFYLKLWTERDQFYNKYWNFQFRRNNCKLLTFFWKSFLLAKTKKMKICFFGKIGHF